MPVAVKTTQVAQRVHTTVCTPCVRSHYAWPERTLHPPLGDQGSGLQPFSQAPVLIFRLAQPRLLECIVKDFARRGVVGEKANF